MISQETSSYISIFKELVIPTCALLFTGFSICIAFRQKKINEAQLENNRNQLKLNLYNRRFVVYEHTKNLISRVLQKAVVNLEEFTKYNDDIKESKFLFDEDIIIYISEIYNNAYRKSQIDLFHGISRETDLIYEYVLLCIYLSEEQKELAIKFSKYLDLKNVAN